MKEITTVQQVASVAPELRKPKRRKPRTIGEEIICGLVQDGLLPFRFRCPAAEAMALSQFLRDLHAAHGTSGDLKTVDLASEPNESTRRWRQKRSGNAAFERSNRVINTLRAHEKQTLRWLENSRTRLNVTLTNTGKEWCGSSDVSRCQGFAIGTLQALARSIAEAYPSDYYQQHPGKAA